MIVWMFIGTYCMGLFVASVTSEFLAPGNNQDSLAKLTSITELDIKLSVGTAGKEMRGFLKKINDKKDFSAYLREFMQILRHMRSCSKL
jgi:hypothetical protein